MTPAFLLAAAALLIAQLALPKKLAFLPLLIAGCHLGNGQIIGDFSISRMLILVGVSRAVAGGFFVWRKNSKLDVIFLIFSVVAVLSSIGHRPEPFNPWTFRLGLAYNVFGTYVYARSYLPDVESFRRFALLLPIVLVPLGLAMTLEKGSQRNLYFILGASSPYSTVREGKVRAQGPFSHAILAGCAGATSLPLAFLVWREKKRAAGIIGFGSCLAVTFASSSSGPLAAVAVTAAAALLWRWRTHLSVLRWAAVLFGLTYWVVKGRGPWFLMASIDLVGGSTGYFRAQLMDQGMKYISDWWLCGTDYTRHWMATGVSWNPDHTDMTNYYLHLGVIGGLGLALSLVAMLSNCFRNLGRRMAALRAIGHPDEMVLWCAGAALAAHAISFVSISYFDQMYVLFYMLVGTIPGLCNTAGQAGLIGDETVYETEASNTRSQLN